MKRIGQWLKQQRLKAGISQLDTAYEAYVSVETLRAIEKGDIYPRTNHFEKLCSLFGVNPGDYYNSSSTPKVGDKSPENLPEFPPKKTPDKSC